MKYLKSLLLVLTLVLCLMVFSNWAYFVDTGTIEDPFIEYLLLVLASLLVVTHIVYWVSKVVFKATKAHLLSTMLFLVGLFSLLVPEVIAYKTGWYSLGFGSSGNELYHSPNKVPHKGWLQKYPPDRVYSWQTTEFESVFWINSLGYRDEEWCIQSTGLRILSLGDSFTEGVGAKVPWVKHLELSLTEAGIAVESMNAGIASSDIVYDLYKMKSDLLQFRPDIVFLCINNTDISNIMGRGCTERYIDHNGSKYVEYKDAPRWEYIYGASHFFRAICRPLNLSVDRTGKDELLAAYECFDEYLSSFHQLSEEHAFKLVVVFHPLDTDILRNGYGLLEPVISQSTEKGITTVDLLPYYLKHVAMDVSNIDNYFWPEDRHQKDYKVFADGVLHQLGYGFFANDDTANLRP